MFYKYDVFLNIAGGLKVNDTSTDLGIAMSLVSSLNNQPLSKNTIVIGEIGLTGEVRPVSGLVEKIKEAEKLGFKKAIVPNVKKFSYRSSKIDLIKVNRIEEALKKLEL